MSDERAGAVGLNEPACANCGAPQARTTPIVTTRVRHECHLYGSPLRVVVCRDCGLVFISPRPLKASIDRLYAEELYATPKQRRPISAPKPDGKVTIRMLYSALSSAIPRPVTNQRVLDIGANEGRWLALFDSSNTLVGIEPSAAALRPCRDDMTLVRSDLETASFREPFDLVTATALIEHLYDPVAGLVKMNELLRDGGLVFLYTPDVKQPAFRRGIARYFKIVHLYYFSVETLSSLLHKCGFAVVASGRYPPSFSSPLTFPQTGSVGTFWLLAGKVAPVTLAGAAIGRPSTGPDEADAAIRAIQQAIGRDRFFSQASTAIMHMRRVRSRTARAIRSRFPLLASR